ncbi:MAG TPA: HAD family hydrolase, partial [Thermoplasmata archaeon]|nr:HAD family hydrolase [Thermoplasmata archaeon]
VARRAVRAMQGEAAALQSLGRSGTIRSQAAILARRTGRKVPVDVVAEAIRSATLRAPIRTAPGAVVALRELRRLGIQIALVSNVLLEPPEAIRTLLERHRLLGLFDIVYLSAEHRDAKPSGRPLLEVLGALRIPPHRAIHVGDHSDDVAAALAASVPPVRYTGLRPGRIREGRSALARIPPGVPTFAQWGRFPQRLGPLYHEALGALALARSAARRRGGRARYARA